MEKISPKSARELTQIIKLLPIEEFNKIPSDLTNYLEKIEDKNYSTKIKAIEDISENNIMEETKNNLAYIFLNYLADKETKKEYEMLLQENEFRHQKELQEKYNIEKIFKQRQETKYNSEVEQETISLTIIKKKKLLNKIIEKIKNIFK